MRWTLLVLIGCDGGGADCEEVPLNGGPGCEPTYSICCDNDGACWSEREDGTVYPAGEEFQLVCDACSYGTYTEAAVGCE